MKYVLILDDFIDENNIDLSIKSQSRLELELSESNIFMGSGGSNLLNTDYLPEGENNLYLTNDRVASIFNNMMPDIPSTSDDITEGVNNLYFTQSRVNSIVDPLLETKLDKSDYVQHFRGVYASYSSLSSSLQTALEGDYAHIDSGGGFDRMLAIWDSSDTKWVVKDVHVASNTDEITEGSNNLYFKSERVRDVVRNMSTTDIPEGTNLYFTEARVNSLLTPITNQIGQIDQLLTQILGG